MKTSMQILSKYIDEMQERYIALSKNDKKLQTRVNAILTATTLIKMQINDWGIEKEKEQIEIAFDLGRDEVTSIFIIDGEDYYNKKFNQNK
jgi:hypothetical protein